ncbi:endonuclease/exonuclease/phosphatase family protein [Hydrogenimonas sp. SS33]|uniref:endonuclease/exonuclease/phosphatase family protein n=1 Tax=Hydrogenimonas leucolamina TaxID=2954236 RepID=UPI00336BE61D
MPTLLLLWLATMGALWGQTIKVASYNVENLFDLKKSGSEYTEYIPYTGYGWNEKAFAVKIRNISRVICDLRPDIIGLQEIESDEALRALQQGVKRCGWRMPYRAIADRKPTVVKTALLSRFPILSKREIDPDGSLHTRDILEVTVDVQRRPLTLFVNHWKSRSGPESRRIVSAKALIKRLAALPKGSDYILLGDFNSDWQEWRTLPDSPRLNDTHGLTGINHLLKTIRDDKPVTKRGIVWPYHYDLWLELPPQRRWSHNFYGHKNALDHLLLPASMFDDRGINYKDRSFRRFMPYYLFQNGAIFRWQIAKHRHGRHLDAGYSDHLPIYATFTTAPYVPAAASAPRARKKAPEGTPATPLHIADLYKMPLGWMNGVVENAVVIYKKGRVAILKEPGGRAILVYRDTGALREGMRYRVAVRKLYDYRGLREVTKLDVLEKLGKAEVGPLLLHSPKDLRDSRFVNEVVAEISGVYRRGVLHYGDGQKIRLYFKDRKRKPRNGARLSLKRVRVSLYRNRPELVAE